MATPLDSEILRVWDAGAGTDHMGRALLLLSLAPPAGNPGRLSVGARDAVLLDLRERLFGARIEAVERCPACGADLEIAFDLADIRVTPAAPPDQVEVRQDGYLVTARIPTVDDLLAIRSVRDVAEARGRLLARCVVARREAEDDIVPDELPVAVQEAVASALAAADPQADVELALSCAACGHAWTTHFDVVRFLWAEIEHFGRRALLEVHQLARAYGWSERETLALTPQRRRRYLELVSDG